MDSIFSPEEKSSLLAELERERDFAQSLSTINRRRDTAFKIVLFLLTLATAVASAVIAASKDPSEGLLISNAITAAVATALAGFISPFDLAGRRRIFQKKAFANITLINQLKHEEPERGSFLKKIAIVRAWDESNPPDENFDIFGI